ncbi:hypothetical protein D3C86_987760 [compost metagenome]
MRGIRVWHRCSKRLDALFRQRELRPHVFDDARPDPAWHRSRNAGHGQRVQAAVQEHRINDGAHVGVIEGNLDLRADIAHAEGRRIRLGNAPAFQLQLLQIAIPSILHHAQQRASGRKPFRHRLPGEQPLAAQDACHMLGKRLRQSTVGEVQAQHLAPEVHRCADGSRRQLIDVFKDEVLRFAFTTRRLQLGLVGIEQRGQQFRLHLSHRAVGQLGEQFGQAQAHRRAGVMHDVPRQFVCVVVAQMHDQSR